MKTQPSFLRFYFPLVLSILMLSLSSCKEDNYDPVTQPDENGTVSDVDGNIYPTAALGGQIWITENLKTTRYSDGTTIEYIGNDTLKWQNNTTGAYAWHENNEENKDLYGGLYNWYAINNTHGLCPAGWHVATPEDWHILLEYLQDEHGATQNDSVNPAGNILKSCKQVDSPMGGDCNTVIHPRWEFHATHYGTDGVGFAALPGGDRLPNGAFGRNGLYGHWWAHDPVNDTDTCASYRYMNFDKGRVFGGQDKHKKYGLSVRCVKN